MFSLLSSVAVLGAVAVNAAPMATSVATVPAPSSTAQSSGQIPFTFPLPNGFPTNLTNTTKLQLENQAHGTLPNGPLPSKLSATSVVTLELIAANEIFEVAYFTSLMNNITNNVTGYQIESKILRNFLLETLSGVQAQEEFHYLGANGILEAAGEPGITPCEYVFPVSDVDSAINLARTFTDLVLGTLQAAQFNFATDGDAELVPLVGGIIGQEGEQDGYFRTLLDLIPSANPILTASAPQFAISALEQNFLVPNSCSGPAFENLAKNVPSFGVLSILTKSIGLEDQTLQFSITGNTTDIANGAIAFVNQQNVPVAQELTNIQVQGDVVTFDAFFPAMTNLNYGLTIAALTSSKGPFANVTEVAAAGLNGPGLIQIL